MNGSGKPGVSFLVGSAIVAALFVLVPSSFAQTPSVDASGCTPFDAGAVPVPTPSAPPIRNFVDGPSGAVAMTFDAGADLGFASDMLDTLRDENVPGTFGMTGRWAEANPDVVMRMAADGHMVINHTLDHRSFTGISDGLGGLSAQRRQSELLDADAIIAPLIGHTTCPWYRLPYGDDDAREAGDVAAVGYTQKVGWDVDTLGWNGASRSAIISRSLAREAPNAVYIMHVGSQSEDASALRAVIDGLKSDGYGFATVDALPG